LSPHLAVAGFAVCRTAPRRLQRSVRDITA